MNGFYILVSFFNLFWVHDSKLWYLIVIAAFGSNLFINLFKLFNKGEKKHSLPSPSNDFTNLVNIFKLFKREEN